MSPVPDPSQNHRGSPLEDISYPENGIGLIAAGSSSEEEDHQENEIGQYQSLPQGPENLVDDEEAIDYSSLSGLMSSLNSHGPNEVNIDDSISSQVGVRASGIHCSEETHSLRSDVLKCDSTFSATRSHDEFEGLRSREYRKEQAALWNSDSTPNQIEIDEDKKEVIKSAMAKITLPNSAIPPWARELSEEDWKTQVYSRLFGHGSRSEQI